MATYVENVYDMFKRKGLDKKYEFAGIYCIKIKNKIVYVGKSANMLRRIAQHYVGIKTGSERKYRVMAEAQAKGYRIDFDVLYYARSKGKVNQFAEIGKQEGYFIRKYMPLLNSQIPDEEDWNKFSINKAAQTITADELIEILIA